MKTLLMNKKIIIFMPNTSNELSDYPIILLNNNIIDYSLLRGMIIDEKYQSGILITEDNYQKRDDNIYYIPMKEIVIEEIKNKNITHVIICEGYLEDFTEKKSILIPIKIREHR